MEAHNPTVGTTASDPSAHAWCIRCGYHLHGLPENRCPECGRGFDPRDPRTFGTGRVPNVVKRWLLKTPGWPTTAFAGVLAAIALAGLSIPGGQLLLLMFAAIAWQVLLVAYVLRLIVHAVLILRMRNARWESRLRWRKWLVVPAIFSLLVTASLLDAPLQMSW
ncbi:MAG: hypothetical protein AMXMBFR13_34810 [Phycisphaerae bacterium]